MKAKRAGFWFSVGSVAFAGGAACATNSGSVSHDSGTVPGIETGTGSSSMMIVLPGSSTGSSSTASSSAAGTSAGDAATDASEGDGGSGSGSGSDGGGSSGSSSASSTGTSAGTSSGSASSSSSHASGDAGICYKPPTALHTETAAGVYCPFSAGDGGTNITCAAGKQCCEPPGAGTVSTCVSVSASCPVTGSTSWKCEGAPDCASTTGTVCCGTGTIEQQVAQPSCGDGGIAPYPYVSGFTGSSCTASCTTYQICSQSSECPPSASTCVPIEPKGNGIGYCK